MEHIERSHTLQHEQGGVRGRSRQFSTQDRTHGASLTNKRGPVVNSPRYDNTSIFGQTSLERDANPVAAHMVPSTA